MSKQEEDAYDMLKSEEINALLQTDPKYPIFVPKGASLASYVHTTTKTRSKKEAHLSAKLEEAKENLVSAIVAAIDNLYCWDKFPIALPEPIVLAIPASVASTTKEGSKIIELKLTRNDKVFNFTPAKDLQVVAIDPATQKLRKLSQKHLQQIWETGTFTINSQFFPGKCHKWKLSPLMIEGTTALLDNWKWYLAIATFQLNEIKCRLTFPPGCGYLATRKSEYLKSAATAQSSATPSQIDAISASIIDEIITTKQQTRNSNSMNIIEALRRIGNAAWNLLDLLIGLIDVTSKFGDSPQLLAAELEKAEKSYVLSNHQVPPANARAPKYTTRQFENYYADTEHTTPDHPLASVNYMLPPKKSVDTACPPLDARLWNSKLVQAVSKELQRIAKATMPKLVQIKEQFIQTKTTELDKTTTNDEAAAIIANQWVDYVNAVIYDAILESKHLEQLGAGIGALVAGHLKAIEILEAVCSSFSTESTRHVDKLIDQFEQQHSIISKISSWKWQFKVEQRLKFSLSNEFKYLVKYLATLRTEHAKQKFDLSQEIYLVERHIEFVKNHKENQRKNLVTSAYLPTREYCWARRIWNPHYWIIKKNLRGKYYIATCYDYHESTSSQVGWRLRNIWVRSYTWLRSYRSFWCDRFSIRSLFYLKPFSSSVVLDSNTGKLMPSPNKVGTVASKIVGLWRHVSASVAQFEATPDTGILGKGVTRIFHRIWNYGVKGVLGTLLVALFYPLAICINLIATLLFALTLVLTAPASSLFKYAFNLLIFDEERPRRSPIAFPLLAYILRLFLVPAFRIVTSVAFGVVVHPVLSAFATLVGSARLGIAYTRDFVIHSVVLRFLGRCKFITI